MLIIHHFVIMPSEHLVQRLAGASDSNIPLLLGKPELWSKRQHGRTTWTIEDYQIAIKLLFLITLQQEYLEEENDSTELKQIVEELLGSRPYTEETFDRWWQIEHIDRLQAVEDLGTHLAASHLALIGRTGNQKIDSWFSTPAEETAQAQVELP